MYIYNLIFFCSFTKLTRFKKTTKVVKISKELYTGIHRDKIL